MYIHSVALCRLLWLDKSKKYEHWRETRRSTLRKSIYVNHLRHLLYFIIFFVIKMKFYNFILFWFIINWCLTYSIELRSLKLQNMLTKGILQYILYCSASYQFLHVWSHLKLPISIMKFKHCILERHICDLAFDRL